MTTAPGRAGFPGACDRPQLLRYLPRPLLRPLPLFVIQPVLTHMIRTAVRLHPRLFERLQAQGSRRYLIDPLNLPFALLLQTNAGPPAFRAVRRRDVHGWDARIAGTVLTLLAMVDGRRDGDALFFNRDLVIEGDTEAVVALRNALDDLDGSLAEDVATAWGPPARAILSGLRRIGVAG
jgi:predicted lipid carrier protein YhbT